MAYGDRHLARTSFKGPVSGHYAIIHFGRDVVAASTTYVHRILVPFDCRVMEVNTIYDTLTGAAPDYQINKTGGLSIVATRALPAADTNETITPTSSPALANRDLVKGNQVSFTVTAGVGEAVDGLTCQITVWVKDHVVADEAND